MIENVPLTGYGVAYNLSVTDITGPGSVSATDIDCPTDCQSSYPPGTTVNITATPGPGSYLDHWGGDISGAANPYALLMDSDKTITATFVCGVSFSDVPSGFWAEEYIKELYCNGITTGCTKNPLNYCPSNNVTRQAMAAFIIRALEGEPPVDYCSGGSPFTDVPTTSQFCKYIKRLSELGIATGCTATEYCPFSPVSRQAMAAFIIRAVEGEPPADYCNSGSPFTDVPTTSQFCKYVKRFSELGITTGCTATEYCPFNSVTRAATAASLARAFLGMP